MENKFGLLKLGWVTNLKPNEKGQNCVSFLSQLIGRKITLNEINTFIESDVFKKEFIDNDGNITEEEFASGFRFKLPWQDVKGNDVYGYYTKKGAIFSGVMWQSDLGMKKYGDIDPTCWEKLKSICGIDITEVNIGEYINSKIEYYNGAGYTSKDGIPTNEKTGKFVKFSTNINTDEGHIVGWFTKNFKGRFEGISWGTENDFKAAQDLREQFYVGRMVFDSIEKCNIFFEKLKGDIIPETWEFKHKKDDTFKYPILKSYLQFELDRLFYEQDVLNYPDRIITNESNSKVWFNTNLINIWGKELFLVGTILEISNKIYISDLETQPAKLKMREMGFESSRKPLPPEFFKDINEIFFHWDWEIDLDMIKSEHIIGDRKERFPEKYHNMTTDSLGRTLDTAIELARSIAQRNYKFIVPMYYPTANRIQLLMPIYLENSYSGKPDFALVLTPHADEKLYTPETILGLDEVYQDARLIAKPEESWLNPEMIE